MAARLNIHTIAMWLLPALFLAVYLAPLLGVFGWSVSRPEPGAENYVRMLTDADALNIMLRTARVCLLVTGISVLLAYLMAYHWVFGSPARKLFMELCIFIPFWISVLIRAFGWVVILRNKGILNETLLSIGAIAEPLTLVRTEFSVILGMVHFLVPFAVFPIASVMRQIDSRVLLASRGMGASPAFTFWNVFLPLTIPGVFASVIIIFVFALGFFITPAILGGGKIVMIAEYIYIQMFQTSNWGFGAALSIGVLAVVAAMAGLLFRVIRPERLVK
ncbi:ABC transporter permease [Phaeobacter inhibens]|uniref:ABC transporter permease n=1 Tax=Phaeobacter inhibens TaxID=221822 RepID=UPI0021A3A80D|nr:ABC transporter permease [Phaeobacter inhibens]UWR63146.1 ABC transporter permease [Phaeobacter inhibens]UWR78849.1 ABC transporter permease [Phaeobacter inhibens]UWR98680.1 ABC transporter permease [Phaeobacter inhibens]UWS06523.1 ABC transporter permease [Phaeobacter inhibens]